MLTSLNNDEIHFLINKTKLLHQTTGSKEFSKAALDLSKLEGGKK